LARDVLFAFFAISIARGHGYGSGGAHDAESSSPAPIAAGVSDENHHPLRSSPGNHLAALTREQAAGVSWPSPSRQCRSSSAFSDHLCWIATGDPFYAIDIITTFYLGREGAADVTPISAVFIRSTN
jgi:hypothetical protein